MREVGGVAVGEQLCVPASINSMSVTLYRHPAAREGHSLRVEVDSSLDFLHQTLDARRVCAELAVEERERVMAEVLTAWKKKTTQRPTEAKLLYDSSGEIIYPTYQSLRQLRDNRPILLTE